MEATHNHTQPWLGKPATDIFFILLPPFVSLLFIILFPQWFHNDKNMPSGWWVALVLLVDVAHVYSTLFRTYLDRSAYGKWQGLLLMIPFAGFVAGVLLYASSPMMFWRVLAYLAVFHFVRQQYGFMRLYSRQEQAPRWMQQVDTCTVYYATIYPLLYWHLGSPRNFSWFVEGDFFYWNAAPVLHIATAAYWLMLIVYLLKEILLVIRTRRINIPRLAVIGGTLLSWYFGIVYFNGDMAFTLLNVVSHGIPYMALIWIFGKKQSSTGASGKWLPVFFSRYGIILFLGLIFLLAYMEEGLWDMTLWKEHTGIFGMFHRARVAVSDTALCFIVPLLALPQITHYLIDGFIWKIKRK